MSRISTGQGMPPYRTTATQRLWRMLFAPAPPAAGGDPFHRNESRALNGVPEPGTASRSRGTRTIRQTPDKLIHSSSPVADTTYACNDADTGFIHGPATAARPVRIRRSDPVSARESGVLPCRGHGTIHAHPAEMTATARLSTVPSALPAVPCCTSGKPGATATGTARLEQT